MRATQVSKICTLFSTRDNIIDGNAHYPDLCVQYEYKERVAPCWYNGLYVGYNLTVLCSLVSITRQRRLSPSTAPAQLYSGNLLRCKIPAMTQKGFWTIHHSRSWSSVQGPVDPLYTYVCVRFMFMSKYDPCLQYLQSWRGLALTRGQPSHLEASSAFMIHDDPRSSWLLRLHSFPPAAPHASENTVCPARSRQAWKGWELFKWRTWD